MKKRISLEAFESPIGVGFAYMEPIPTFHPPSLRVTQAPEPTKLMKRLLKQEENKLEQFRFNYLLRQPRNVMPAGITVSAIDPSPIVLPYLFHASKRK